MELEFFLKNFTEKNPKPFVEHIQRMASGEAPFFSTTLSLVYDQMVERVFTQSIAPGKSTEGGNQNVPEVTSATQTPNATASLGPSITFVINQQPPDPIPEPQPIPRGAVWLECFQCAQPSRLSELYDGMRCPRCPSRSARKGKPFMQCPSCNLIRVGYRDTCIRHACQARFA